MLWQTRDGPSYVVGGHSWTVAPGYEYQDRVVQPMRPPDSPTLVFVGRDGAGNTATVVNTRTGRRLSSWQMPSDPRGFGVAGGTAAIVGSTLITHEEISDGADDCRTRLVAYDVMTGWQRWHVDAAPWLYRVAHGGTDVKVECDLHFRPGVVGTTLITAAPDRRPQLVDTTTGAVRGYGSPNMAPVGFDAGTLVVQDFGKTRDVVAFDVGTGRERWRVMPAAPKSPEVEGIPGDIPTVTGVAVINGRLVYLQGDWDSPPAASIWPTSAPAA